MSNEPKASAPPCPPLGESASDTPVLSLREAIARMDPRARYHPWIWVEGEVGDVSHAQSGHKYFTLSDGDARISCVIWERVARGIPTPIRNGSLVWVNGWVQPHPGSGHPELDVRSIVLQSPRSPRQEALQKVEDRLRSDGLFDPERKRTLPPSPSCIGIVTSPAGDVLHDITRVLQRRAPGTLMQLVPTRVSGAGASAEIASAIRSLGSTETADLIIVARGGGSAADLHAFNAEEVARAIAASPVPVISAVGHEPDVTLADLVADVRCATPSEAAEIAVPETAGARVSLHAATETVTELRLEIADATVVVRLPSERPERP